jgi:membrane-associated protein
MNSQALAYAVDIISQHGYWFIFFAMVVEGPIVTTAAAFASALGFFHVGIILFLSILANLVADVICYFIGYWGRLRIVEKYSKRFGFGMERVERVERLLATNPFPTIAAIKITPGLATLGLLIVGATKMPFKKFIKSNLYIAFPLSLSFVVLGYYAGRANAIAEKYLHQSQYALILAVIAIVAGSYIYRKVSAAIARRIEKI